MLCLLGGRLVDCEQPCSGHRPACCVSQEDTGVTVEPEEVILRSPLTPKTFLTLETIADLFEDAMALSRH